VFRDLINNDVLWIAVLAWFVAQFIKVILILIMEKRLDIRGMVSSGGMPSSHTATVSALAAAVGLVEGLNSVAFAVATILAVIVMYDAAGVRRAVGFQAHVINRMVKEFRFGRGSLSIYEKDLREIIGHTPFQVIMGCGLGILIAWLWVRFL
jgi:acid phosphatase family membrane protein YuiD